MSVNARQINYPSIRLRLLPILAVLVVLLVSVVPPASATRVDVGEGGCRVYSVKPVEKTHPGAGVSGTGSVYCDVEYNQLTVSVALERNGRRIEFDSLSRYNVSSLRNTAFVRGAPLGSYETVVHAAAREFSVFQWVEFDVDSGKVSF